MSLIKTFLTEINSITQDRVINRVLLNKSFVKWFGKSIVKTKDNKPKIVYHSTKSNFDEFKITKDIGFHFGTKEASNNRINDLSEPSSIGMYFIKIEKPFYGEDLIDWDLDKFYETDFEELNDEIDECNSLEEIKQVFINNGYDGYVYKNYMEDYGEYSYIVFHPENIKSIYAKEFDGNSKNINEIEDNDNKVYRLFDEESTITQSMLALIKHYYENPNEKVIPIKFKVIPKRLLFKTWEDFVKDGFVKNEKNIDRMEDMIINNVAQMRVNNILLGHSQGFIDSDELEYYDLPTTYEAFWDNERLATIADEITFDEKEGQNMISDYGLPKIENILDKLFRENNYEKKLVLIDNILNVIHMRSDLALYFVEGGTNTLAELSGIKGEEDEE